MSMHHFILIHVLTLIEFILVFIDDSLLLYDKVRGNAQSYNHSKCIGFTCISNKSNLLNLRRFSVVHFIDYYIGDIVIVEA